MKTVVSIPDDLFAAAETLALELGVSRSHLFAKAMADFVARHRNDGVTQRLNAVYGKVEAALDPVLEELQYRSVSTESW